MDRNRRTTKGDPKMSGDPAMVWDTDSLSRQVIHAIIQVHQMLGPGFLETIYRNALAVELRRQRLKFTTEREILVIYQGVEVGRHRLDLLVEDRLIVELKAVEHLSRAHYEQVRSYLKASGLKVALLVNSARPVADYRRVESS